MGEREESRRPTSVATARKRYASFSTFTCVLMEVVAVMCCQFAVKLCNECGELPLCMECKEEIHSLPCFEHHVVSPMEDLKVSLFTCLCAPPANPFAYGMSLTLTVQSPPWKHD